MAVEVANLFMTTGKEGNNLDRQSRQFQETSVSTAVVGRDSRGRTWHSALMITVPISNLSDFYENSFKFNLLKS